MRCAYFTKPEWADRLADELRALSETIELTRHHTETLCMILADAVPVRPCFATDVWSDVDILNIQSINDAIAQLKHRRIFGYHVPFAASGRGKLIQAGLRKAPDPEAISFPSLRDLDDEGCEREGHRRSVGGFLLLDASTLVCAKQVWKPFPSGKIAFIENREDPPSRAYLKLWEALFWRGKYPKRGDRCVDFGASPGGWTWVMSSLGVSVLSIDKAPIDARLLKNPEVRMEQVSAFSIPAGSLGEMDWFISDIACYPERALPWIQAWIASGTVRHMICTLKLQGNDVPWEVLSQLRSIPNSCLTHLWYNKHELTFWWDGAENSA